MSASSSAQLSAPERLTGQHDLSGFTSDEPGLDDWLRRRALKNEGRHARTYVTCAGQQVVGFYSLVSGSVLHAEATGRLRRNAPDPIPVMILGRLAVDQRWQGKGIGSGLLLDAILRVLQASEIVGIAALLVHAKSPRAKAFYERHDFEPSMVDPMTLMVRLSDAAKSV